MFLIDTTGSMRSSPHWEQLNSSLRNAYVALGKTGTDLRAGIATFGDLRRDRNGRQDRFHLMNLTPREREFCADYINTIRQYECEGGDEPESCLDALFKTATQALSPGVKTMKVFVLITDFGRLRPDDGQSQRARGRPRTL